ncbi:MAG: murein L,D-transpeptidase catalytic domain family protein, partial [Bdellovibrio sp.]|nr:murein L,D-transpeptidase catalytic domain family protein [Bdellovibrio sp.]
LFTSSANAESLFDRQVRDGRYLFDVLLERGLPKEALDMLFRMFDYNVGYIPNVTTTVLVDYSQASNEKRLYLINLVTGDIQRFYVAHGIRSGVLEARSFSNLMDSWKSSLGFFYAKGTYLSERNGLSLYLQGIDLSNNNARVRAIVLHGARYVSDSFISQNGRLGWSEGCFAVGLEYVDYLIRELQGGSILFSYHKDLMGFSRRYPAEQTLSGNEYIPPGVNTKRTPEEGGGGNSFYEVNFNKAAAAEALLLRSIL